jgi:F-type H+-transporting ATPase subunit epsilon
MRMQPSSGLLQCVVVTPERAVLDELVDFVALPMYDGELGVLPGRAPLIGRLGCGELRIRHGAATRRFFVDGGFTQVRSNLVTVLTPRAIRGEDIDIPSVLQTLETPPTAILVPDAQETERKNRERARAQLRVARHTRGEVAEQ